MAVLLDWTNTSPEYRQALDSYVEHIFKHIKDKDYQLEQINSLAVAAACESTSMMLDPMRYLEARGVSLIDAALAPHGFNRSKSSKQIVDSKDALAFINVQVERFKWILEDAISADYNIPTKLLRQRRLDS